MKVALLVFASRALALFGFRLVAVAETRDFPLPDGWIGREVTRRYLTVERAAK